MRMTRPGTGIKVVIVYVAGILVVLVVMWLVVVWVGS
jgi:hypothetical protein